MPLMGLREYARHRKASSLAGGTLRAVQKAIEIKRINCLIIDGKKQINQQESDELWAERASVAYQAPPEPNAAPPAESGERVLTSAPGQSAPAGATAEAAAIASDPEADITTANYHTARAAKERANAQMAQLELEERQGRLLDADSVAAGWARIISESRTKILALPSKIRTRLPMLTPEHVAIIENLVRDALEELADTAA